METLELLEHKYRAYSCSYWGNEELALVAEAGKTKTSELMKYLKTLVGARVLKHPNKIRRNIACEYLGIDYKEELEILEHQIKFLKSLN